MDSDTAKNSFLSRLRDRADIASQKLNSKILNNLENLRNQFKSKLNLTSVIVFFIIIIILVVFIIFSIYIPTRDIYFSITQYLTVSVLAIILLAFYVINRPIMLKEKNIDE